MQDSGVPKEIVTLLNPKVTRTSRGTTKSNSSQRKKKKGTLDFLRKGGQGCDILQHTLHAGVQKLGYIDAENADVQICEQGGLGCRSRMAAASEAHAISRNRKKRKCSKPIREVPEKKGHRHR